MMQPVFEYDIHLPSNLDPDKKYPVIFTLHGRGSNEKNMFGLVEPLADKFIIIGIRGNLILGAGYQYFNIIRIGHPDRQEFDETVNKLEAFIQYASGKYPIDENRRYLLGFSQGAILSMTLALTMGRQIKGIVALNGYVPGFVKTEYALQSMENVSVFVSHGEYDSVFPVHIGHETAEYMQKQSSHVTFKLYPADHEVIPENQADFIRWLKEDAGV